MGPQPLLFLQWDCDDSTRLLVILRIDDAKRTIQCTVSTHACPGNPIGLKVCLGHLASALTAQIHQFLGFVATQVLTGFCKNV